MTPLRTLVAGLAAGLDRGVVFGASVGRRLRTPQAKALSPEQRIDRLGRLAAF